LFGALKKHLKGIHSTYDGEFKLVWKNGFKNSLKISTATGSKNLFSVGGIVLNDRGTMWKFGLNDQPWSGRPVTATHNLNRQKVNEPIQENQRISHPSIAEN
jgi:hypothetical protein